MGNHLTLGKITPSNIGKEVRVFEMPSTVRPIGTHLPGENWSITDLITKYNSILYYFTLSVMNNIGRRLLRVGGDE